MRTGLFFGGASVAVTLCMGCRSPRATSSASVEQSSYAPAQQRFAWGGFACTAKLPWAGERDNFADPGECERTFASSCAKNPAAAQLTEPIHAQIDGEPQTFIASTRRGPDAVRDSGFFQISFVTQAPLSAAQREALACWGVILGSSIGPVHFGAVSKRALAILAALPFVERISVQREPQLHSEPVSR